MTLPDINIINRKKVQPCGYVAEKLVWIVRKVILEIPEWNFRNETICRPAIYEKETPIQVFPVNTTKFLRTPMLKNICEWLLLQVMEQSVDLLVRRQTLSKLVFILVVLYLLIRRFNEIFCLDWFSLTVIFSASGIRSDLLLTIYWAIFQKRSLGKCDILPEELKNNE